MVDSVIMSQSYGSRADRSTLIKAQFSAFDTSAERGTSDEMEDTHQLVCARPADKMQWIRLEAVDCEGM